MIFYYGITSVDLRLVESKNFNNPAFQHSDKPKPAFVLVFSISRGIDENLRKGIPTYFKQ